MENNENNENIENKKHIEQVYADKAINLLKICIIILIISGLSYLYGIFIYKSFDFGLIFEIISFIFIILAYNKIKQKDFKSGKRNTIISMIPIGWLIIYDLINLFANSQEVLTEVSEYYTSSDQYFYLLEPYLFDVILVATIILLYKSYSSLNQADGSKKDNNYTDTFYNQL